MAIACFATMSKEVVPQMRLARTRLTPILINLREKLREICSVLFLMLKMEKCTLNSLNNNDHTLQNGDTSLSNGLVSNETLCINLKLRDMYEEKHMSKRVQSSLNKW